jgi:rod shape-determining protein MreD
MYFAYIIVLSLVTLVLQTTLFSHLQVKEAKPDLILIIILYLSLLKGPQVGSITGFSFGLLQDVLSGMFLGSNALTKTLLGFILGSIGKRLYANSLLLQIIFVFILTFLNEALLAILDWMLKSSSPMDVLHHWLLITPIEAFYNAFLCPIIFVFLRFGEKIFGPFQK